MLRPRCRRRCRCAQLREKNKRQAWLEGALRSVFGPRLTRLGRVPDPVQAQSRLVGNPVGKRKRNSKEKERKPGRRSSLSCVVHQLGSDQRKESFESRTTRSARGGGRIVIAWSGRRSRLLGFPWIGPCRGTSDRCPRLICSCDL